MAEDNYELNSKTHYDKVASKFDRTWDGFLSGFFKRFIVKNLVFPEHAAVLDIGCANGVLLAMLHEKIDFYGTGIDISPEMVRVAQHHYPEFQFFNASAQTMPFPDQAFDILICSASFHHFPDPAAFLTEACRILKPNGRLIIAEIRIPIYDVRQFYNRHIETHSTEGDVKVYGESELKALFETKFDVIEHKNAWQIQYFDLKKRV